jgi:hypothetical protein
VPGAAAAFIDQWAPAQFVAGSSGGQGPLRSPDVDTSIGDGSVNGNSQTYDPQLTMKLAGTVVLALVVVFVLQASGFRFVVAAG